MTIKPVTYTDELRDLCASVNQGYDDELCGLDAVMLPRTTALASETTKIIHVCDALDKSVRLLDNLRDLLYHCNPLTLDRRHDLAKVIDGHFAAYNLEELG